MPMRTTRTMAPIAGAALVLILCAGAAHAQVGGGQTETRMSIVQNDGEREVKVEVHNDDVKAWVNGQRVPEDRLRVTDEEIRILDERGETVARIGRSPRGLALGRPPRPPLTTERGGIIWQDGDDEIFEIAPPRPPTPPVMIGINMGGQRTPDGALAELLEKHGLDEDDVTNVMGVIEGLPADKAGLREGDVIVALDGKWGADIERVRETLADRKPGDRLKVKVFRGGEVRDAEIELVPFDPEKLGIAGGGGAAPYLFRFEGDGPGRDLDRSIREMAERLRDWGGRDPEEMRQRARELAERLEKDLKRDGAGLHLDLLPRLRGDILEDRVIVRPAPRAEVRSGESARLERIEDRLRRLEERIERLVETLERAESGRD